MYQENGQKGLVASQLVLEIVTQIKEYCKKIQVKHILINGIQHFRGIGFVSFCAGYLILYMYIC